jgi:hypothetical protein
MSVRQLSVFIENRPGHLVRLTTLLEQAGVNVRGFSLSDTGDFGIVRIIVDQPDSAQATLEAGGFLVKVSDVLCLELPDKAGALHQVLQAVAQTVGNLEYGYSLSSTYVCFKVADIQRAEAELMDKQLRILTQADFSGVSSAPPEEKA